MVDVLMEHMVVPDDQDSAHNSEVLEQIHGIEKEPENKQLETLQLIESGLRTKHIMLDKLENYQLGILIQLF